MSNTKHTNILKNVKEALGALFGNDNAELLVANAFNNLLTRLINNLALEPSEKAAALAELEHLRQVFGIVDGSVVVAVDANGENAKAVNVEPEPEVVE